MLIVNTLFRINNRYFKQKIKIVGNQLNSIFLINKLQLFTLLMLIVG